MWEFINIDWTQVNIIILPGTGIIPLQAICFFIGCLNILIILCLSLLSLSTNFDTETSLFHMILPDRTKEDLGVLLYDSARSSNKL